MSEVPRAVYQTFTLPAWSRNPSVRLIKSPKLIWFDAGVQRALSGEIGGLSGTQYESFLVGQVLTTLWSLRMRYEASYLRTSGGLEIDLILESQGGLLALEFKNRPTVGCHDAASIERARRLLGERFRAGIVVYRGEDCCV
ncbi:MAG: DUF4143 domain-containing protein [Gemmatimonas sp.]|nr:DUF4143 domain-containing protein [Gemmatimonas sp.]